MPSALTASEIREAFLKFFEERGHRRVASSSLVPANDPTLMFTNAGMVQFKDVFTGRETRDYRRATTSQKCVRAGGKHNDLDNVGFTARHHTFFEMLGNFSFGDYFKADAIAYGWEFVTRTLGLSTDRLAVTVFNGEGGTPWDEEAYELWKKQGVPAERLYKLGLKDNFWAMGDTGPCGPCSEIHYHQGDDIPCVEEAEGKKCQGVACDCDRWLEIWNLVFMQFERKEKDGPLIPLPKPSIDTGAGLERIASVVQGKRSNYETDLFQNILATVSGLCGKPYSQESGASQRVVADHSRAAAFLISDGVQPSNEGRGYVLRRIMRRAIRHGTQQLGLEDVFFFKVVDRVIELMGDAYPELRESRTFVLEVCRHEETSFRQTLSRGLKLIEEELSELQKAGGKQLSGDVVFLLHGTYGFPWDLTQIIARERGLDVDLVRFEERLKEEADKNKFAGSGDKATGEIYLKLAERLGTTEFLGYEGEGHEGEGSIRAIVKDGAEVTQATQGDTVELVLDRTPFYGESGGQMGDTGRIVGHGGKAVAKVTDAQRPVPGLVVHSVEVSEGTFKVGDMVQAGVDSERRKSIRANHSATHLLHKALKLVLGEHVKQAGSVVAPDYLRFDFAHFSPATSAQLEQVEDLVNNWIRDNAGAETRVMSLEDAKKSGAVAMFGEKYGETVRVVTVHPESTELCGGTHVRRSGDIGLFKIASESGVASGVRRIVALTGIGALQYVREQEHELRKVAELFKSSPKEVSKRVEATQKRVKELERKVEEVAVKAQTASSKDLLEQARDVNGMKVLATQVDAADDNVLRGMADQLRDRIRSGVVAIGGEKDGRAIILVAATKDVVAKGINAGALVREMAKEVGGKGGGKAEMAQAGGPDASKLPAALEKLYELVKGMGTA
ncbi:alanine--tRNA ligase [Myxococcus xanthus]|uniref:Alanine--tRNA ligase n=1 Tax=Myxococcus xanthus TaxID=34 RepID=A0AAE6KUR6_MYXXA|nr:alanine--tRNA ligase [Myxococcus xanthus]QDE70687.1 alanine--tRNA ligase [Myxococcus xanthus]QDE77967.1 alanine--tRNA ligase [Myxococcus xanthus]QDE85348.1 alanine--tRNA ligase [Myxococcus xanthus]